MPNRRGKLPVTQRMRLLGRTDQAVKLHQLTMSAFAGIEGFRPYIALAARKKARRHRVARPRRSRS